MVVNTNDIAAVAELADAQDSGSCARLGRAGSTPAGCIIKALPITKMGGAFYF